MYKIINNDSLLALEELEENSIDSIVTDPPYELNFMGKGWDNAGISFNKKIWQKCLRVLKPGGYLLAFGGSRTFHRIACAIEDAGFEIRDTIMWLYGSGFPKSMSLSKGLEAKEKLGNASTRNKRKIEQACDTEEYKLKQTNNGAMGEIIETTRKEYIPDTDLAKQWNGWGTALKPSFEPIIVARKPFKGSLVDNVIQNGVGGINIDECRVGNEELHNSYAGNKNTGFTSGDERNDKGKGMFSGNKQGETVVNGRFPANTILTYDKTDFDEVCGGFPNTKGGTRHNVCERKSGFTSYGFLNNTRNEFNDSGSASRYFYCAKASKKDRDEGLDNFELKGAKELLNREENSDGASWNGKYSSGNAYAGAGCPKKNTHPTVKPTELMQYLVRLVTPKGGTILDPFMGSGSTGKAVMFENKERNADYSFIGIEREKEYCDIAEARISFASKYEIPKEEKNQISFTDLLDG